MDVPPLAVNFSCFTSVAKDYAIIRNDPGFHPIATFWANAVGFSHL
jgi:hypothetical protein